MQAGKSSPRKREYIPHQEFTPDCEPSPSKVQKDHTHSTKTHFTYKECQKGERVEKESKGLKRNNSKEK